jgi:seryl-tRNA synthetase
MLDLNIIRQNTDWVKEQFRKLQAEDVIPRVDAILELDQKRRQLLTKSEAFQANRNKLNKGVGRLRGDQRLSDKAKVAIAIGATNALNEGDILKAVAFLEGTDEAPAVEGDLSASFDALSATLGKLGDIVNALIDELRPIDEELNTHLLWLPNIPHESVPVGVGDEDNIPSEPVGELRKFDFVPKPHWEIGTALGMIDFERGVKLAGSRAYLLRGWGARLQRALEAFFLDQAREKGFEEVYVPFFVKEEMLYGAGQFPKFTDVVYYDADAEVYMLPTSEVAITNIFRDEILDEADLPLYFVADTPCFRREKTSAGRDTRGIKRVHQFQKVEMYKFVHPDTSYDELDKLVQAACDIAAKLGLPYRTLEICTGDLGFSATKKYDVEIYAPGSDEWLEVSSCSNTEDFQARRANLRFRPTEGKKTQFMHTLNGSGLATPRVIIAILENYQQADGSVLIPEALQPYLGTDRITAE